MNHIKQSYLKDRAQLIKEGAKPLNNKLDDFFAWCEAKNIVTKNAASFGTYEDNSGGYVSLRIQSPSFVSIDIPQDILEKGKDSILDYVKSKLDVSGNITVRSEDITAQLWLEDVSGDWLIKTIEESLNQGTTGPHIKGE